MKLLNFATTLIEDGVRGVESNQGNCDMAIRQMLDADVKIISADEL